MSIVLTDETSICVLSKLVVLEMKASDILTLGHSEDERNKLSMNSSNEPLFASGNAGASQTKLTLGCSYSNCKSKHTAKVFAAEFTSQQREEARGHSW